MSEKKNEIEERKNEVAELGDGEVFIKRSSDGLIKAVKGSITLAEEKGHLAEIQGKVMITANGYNELNKIPGISIITPETLTLPDGEKVVNPYPVIDQESGSITKVWCKKLGVGLSPIGNMVITSSTLLYDIRMYFIQDIIGKVKSNKDAGRVCTEALLTEEEKDKGMFLKFEGEMGIWVDVEHPAILQALNTFINNKLFAERKAQTICERNVLKKHPALSKVYVEPQGPKRQRVARVSVVGYTHDFSKDELLEISEQASDADEGEVEVSGQKAEVINVSGDVEEEDIAAAADEGLDPDVSSEDVEEMMNEEAKQEGLF